MVVLSGSCEYCPLLWRIGELVGTWLNLHRNNRVVMGDRELPNLGTVNIRVGGGCITTGGTMLGAHLLLDLRGSIQQEASATLCRVSTLL